MHTHVHTHTYTQLGLAARDLKVDTMKECLKQKGIDVNELVHIGGFNVPALTRAIITNVKPDSSCME